MQVVQISNTTSYPTQTPFMSTHSYARYTLQTLTAAKESYLN